MVESIGCFSKGLGFHSQWQLRTTHNSSSQASDAALFWPPQALGTDVVHRHTHRQNTQTDKL